MLFNYLTLTYHLLFPFFFEEDKIKRVDDHGRCCHEEQDDEQHTVDHERLRPPQTGSH